MFDWFKKLWARIRRKHPMDLMFEKHGLGSVDMNRLKDLYLALDERITGINAREREFNRQHTKWHEDMDEKARREMLMREEKHRMDKDHYSGNTTLVRVCLATEIVKALITHGGDTQREEMVCRAFDCVDTIAAEAERRYASKS